MVLPKVSPGPGSLRPEGGPRMPEAPFRVGGKGRGLTWAAPSAVPSAASPGRAQTKASPARVQRGIPGPRRAGPGAPAGGARRG